MVTWHFLTLPTPEVTGNRGGSGGEHTAVERAWLSGHAATQDRLSCLSQILGWGFLKCDPEPDSALLGNLLKMYIL